MSKKKLKLDLVIEEVEENFALYGGSGGVTAQHYWAWTEPE
ncbi:hypothetical protein [Anoxybacter fermentans]|nr:hypothetical protein [Anoxybacter fermentans]